jgi:hypothetical protein
MYVRALLTAFSALPCDQLRGGPFIACLIAETALTKSVPRDFQPWVDFVASGCQTWLSESLAQRVGIEKALISLARSLSSDG